MGLNLDQLGNRPRRHAQNSMVNYGTAESTAPRDRPSTPAGQSTAPRHGGMQGDIYMPRIATGVGVEERPRADAAGPGFTAPTDATAQMPRTNAGEVGGTGRIPMLQDAANQMNQPQPPQPPQQPLWAQNQPQSQDVLTGYSRMGSFYEPQPLNNQGVPNTGGGFGSIPSGG